MASITLTDLALSQALDRKAVLSIQGAGAGDWVIGAFPCYVAPIPIPRAVDIFNFYQQIINNVTYIGQMVNQTTNVAITNTGASSTNNVIALPSISNTGA